jgi:hypothetical protein
MRRSITCSLALCASALAAGCSGMTSTGLTPLSPPVAQYTSASIFSPAGYSQSKIDDTHYTVAASGTEATPISRVEKIARARAAEIGVEEKMPYFKVTNVQQGMTCGKRQEGYKSAATPASSHPSVILDVVYAKDAADPTFQNAVEAVTTLKTDLAAEEVAPEARAVATQETREGCSKG